MTSSLMLSNLKCSPPQRRGRITLMQRHSFRRAQARETMMMKRTRMKRTDQVTLTMTIYTENLRPCIVRQDEGNRMEEYLKPPKMRGREITSIKRQASKFLKHRPSGRRRSPQVPQPSGCKRPVFRNPLQAKQVQSHPKCREGALLKYER